jgi:hypothetical protein
VQDTNKIWWLLQLKTLELLEMNKPQGGDSAADDNPPLEMVLPGLQDILAHTVSACIASFGRENCVFIAPKAKPKRKKKMPEQEDRPKNSMVFVTKDPNSAQVLDDVKPLAPETDAAAVTQNATPAEAKAAPAKKLNSITKAMQNIVKAKSAPDRTGCCIGRYCVPEDPQGSLLAGVRVTPRRDPKKLFWFVILADEDERGGRATSKSAPSQDPALGMPVGSDHDLNAWKDAQMDNNRSRVPLSAMIPVCDGCYEAYTRKAKERLERQQEEQRFAEEAKRAEEYLRYAEWKEQQEEQLRQVLLPPSSQTASAFYFLRHDMYA